MPPTDAAPTSSARTPLKASAPRTPSWLGPFFTLAAGAPNLARALRPLACRLMPACSRRVRESTALNARRIFGRELSHAESRRYARAVAGSFFDFVTDVAHDQSPEEARRGIRRVEGLEGYRAARAARRGGVLVTAHLGSFERGLAALAGVEPRIRLVFRRDASAVFERQRARLRARLGVLEAPIDEGWSSWLPLRDALLADEVVVLQGDRAIDGQRSIRVPFLHGHLRLPTGPVRLARLTGSPIIPVFAPRLPEGGVAVILGAPIEPCDSGADLTALAAAIESVVARHPDQWLAFEPVFDEDASHGR